MACRYSNVLLLIPATLNERSIFGKYFKKDWRNTLAGKVLFGSPGCLKATSIIKRVSKMLEIKCEHAFVCKEVELTICEWTDSR
jgi:hypothetical protein